MKDKPKNILFIGAHTDDEHGASGLLYKLASAGHKVDIIITTSDVEKGTCVEKDNYKVRKFEMRKVADMLGFRDVLYLDQPDGKLELTDQVQTYFNNLVDTIPAPDLVLCHSPIDIHPDHRNTASLAMKKFFQSGVNIPFFLYALNSATWRHENVMPQTLGFYPTHYSAITRRVMGLMKEADAFHVSQNGEKVNSMFRGVQASLRGRGKEIDVEYAEGFMYITRHGPVPSWLIDSGYLIPYRHKQRGIPFKVVPAAIGLK